MLLILVLGVMLGAAGVVLMQQWYSGALAQPGERASLPRPTVARPRGVAAMVTERAPRLEGRRAA
jgi:hypothetical protein